MTTNRMGQAATTLTDGELVFIASTDHVQCGDAVVMARELLAYRKASKNPVADVVAWNKSGEERKCDIRWRRFDVAPGPLYAVPPIPDVTMPEGWCVMPLEQIKKMMIDSQRLSKIQDMTPNLFTNPHGF